MTTTPPLAPFFLAPLPPHLAEEAAAIPGLEAQLKTLLTDARSAWPHLPITEEHFLQELAARMAQTPPQRGVAQWLEHVHAGDFLLALGCARGDKEAVEKFCIQYKTDLERLVSRYQSPQVSAEDLRQHLLEKLFVSVEGRPAKIRDYSGQGFLQNWLRVTGTRAFIDQLRSVQGRAQAERGGLDEQLFAVADVHGDLELDFLKREYRARFKEAFAAAVTSLSSEERNLLRQHLVAQLTLEQLGKLYGVHLSTISRRVQRAREALLEGTRNELQKLLKVEKSELESLMQLVQSRLELSAARLLGASDPGSHTP